MPDFDFLPRREIRIRLPEQTVIFRNGPNALRNPPPTLSKTSSGRLGDLVLFPLANHFELGCNRKEGLRRKDTPETDREVFSRGRVKSIAVQIRDRYATVMEQHPDLLRSKIPEARSVSRNSLQDLAVFRSGAPFGAEAEPAFAEPEAQVVRGAVVGMMACGAGDILVSAEDGIEEEQPSRFNGLGVHRMEMAVIENRSTSGGARRHGSEPQPDANAKCGRAAILLRAIVPLTLIFLAGPVFADIEHARQLMKAGAFEDAREELWPAARSGNADAEELIGVMYALGLGVERDDVRAFEWYLRAAMKGHPGAQSGVGWYYEVGRGMPAPDLVRAYLWYVLSTIGGDPDAAISQEEVVKKMSPAQVEKAHELIDDYRVWLYPFR